MKLEPGQTVVLVPGSYERSPAREVKIVRVARKYAYVDLGYGEVGFDLETGREKGSQFSNTRLIRTVEKHAEIQRRHNAEQRLHKLGIRPKDASSFVYSVETLEAVIDLLERDAARPDN